MAKGWGGMRGRPEDWSPHRSFLFKEMMVFHAWDSPDGPRGVYHRRDGTWALVDDQGSVLLEITLEEARALKAEYPSDIRKGFLL